MTSFNDTARVDGKYEKLSWPVCFKIEIEKGNTILQTLVKIWHSSKKLWPSQFFVRVSWLTVEGREKRSFGRGVRASFFRQFPQRVAWSRQITRLFYWKQQMAPFSLCWQSLTVVTLEQRSYTNIYYTVSQDEFLRAAEWVHVFVSWKKRIYSKPVLSYTWLDRGVYKVASSTTQFKTSFLQIRSVVWVIFLHGTVRTARKDGINSKMLCGARRLR